MSNEPFSRMVNQLSAQAEQQRADDARAELRRQKIARIARLCGWMLALCALGVAFVYRDEVLAASRQFGAQISPAPAAVATAGAPDSQAGKLKKMMENVEKHSASVDAAGQ
ncbi:MAG: hypothetical protein WCS70_10190 [Verrucomicrobiota bacterium]